MYGALFGTLMSLAAEREVAPGGAFARLLAGDAPTWACGACLHQWRNGLYGIGDGRSMESAVVIRGVDCTAVGIRAEWQWVTEHFRMLPQEAAEPATGWSKIEQTLVSAIPKHFDLLTIGLPDGTEHTVVFEISGFYGRPPYA